MEIISRKKCEIFQAESGDFHFEVETDGNLNEFYNDDDRMIKITRSDDGSKVVIERSRVMHLLDTWGYLLEKLANTRESTYQLYLKQLQKMMNNENNDGNDVNSMADLDNPNFNYMCENVYKRLLEFDVKQIQNEL